MAQPNILRNIKPHHLPIIWKELHERFGFNMEGWKKKFEGEMKRQPRGVEPVEFMLVFGVRKIDPVLNKILCRKEEYSSFLLMVGRLTAKKI